MKLRTKLLLSPALSALLLALCLGVSIWLLMALQAGSRATHQRAEAADIVLHGVQGELGDVHATLYRTAATMAKAEGKAIELAQDKQAARLDELANHLAKLTGDGAGEDLQKLIVGLREQIGRASCRERVSDTV